MGVLGSNACHSKIHVDNFSAEALSCLDVLYFLSLFLRNTLHLLQRSDLSQSRRGKGEATVRPSEAYNPQYLPRFFQGWDICTMPGHARNCNASPLVFCEKRS